MRQTPDLGIVADDPDEIFAQLDDLDKIGNTSLRKRAKPLIVLDAQNVAMRHGCD